AIDPSMRPQLYDRADRALERSWSDPSAWHAGATQALSDLFLQRANNGAANQDLQQSAYWATRTAALAPLEPYACARLAELRARGGTNPLCDSAASCLNRSYAAARMADNATACLRLRVGHEQGLLRPNDPKLDDYAWSCIKFHRMEPCLTFLSPDEL